MVPVLVVLASEGKVLCIFFGGRQHCWVGSSDEAHIRLLTEGTQDEMKQYVTHSLTHSPSQAGRGAGWSSSCLWPCVCFAGRACWAVA